MNLLCKFYFMRAAARKVKTIDWLYRQTAQKDSESCLFVFTESFICLLIETQKSEKIPQIIKRRILSPDAIIKSYRTIHWENRIRTKGECIGESNFTAFWFTEPALSGAVWLRLDANAEFQPSGKAFGHVWPLLCRLTAVHACSAGTAHRTV